MTAATTTSVQQALDYISAAQAPVPAKVQWSDERGVVALKLSSIADLRQWLHALGTPDVTVHEWPVSPGTGTAAWAHTQWFGWKVCLSAADYVPYEVLDCLDHGVLNCLTCEAECRAETAKAPVIYTPFRMGGAR